jgi:hypothetical protein
MISAGPRKASDWSEKERVPMINKNNYAKKAIKKT